MAAHVRVEEAASTGAYGYRACGAVAGIARMALCIPELPPPLPYADGCLQRSNSGGVHTDRFIASLLVIGQLIGIGIPPERNSV